MTKAAHSLKDLVNAGVLAQATPELESVAALFSVAVTPAMLELIDPTDPLDPIARQFIPSPKERDVSPHERVDPIGDMPHSPVHGIVHRYPDRVLLKLLHLCPVYCRFCFRREQVGHDQGTLSADQLEAALGYIRAHGEIWEVILSGGDPLLLSDRRLRDVVDALHGIEHVKVIRIHTRFPVVEPKRITPSLVEVLRGGKPVYLLLHCNHVRELTVEARTACALLVDGGIPILSQSVLLKGVNDTVEALTDLMRCFVENRIKPHYLHHGDLAIGTAHFRVPIQEGQELLRQLRGRISGLCQPTYILDIPGGFGKVPIGPTFASRDDEWRVTDVHGEHHRYSESENEDRSP